MMIICKKMTITKLHTLLLILWLEIWKLQGVPSTRGHAKSCGHCKDNDDNE